jgi:hypothetical protein
LIRIDNALLCHLVSRKDSTPLTSPRFRCRNE